LTDCDIVPTAISKHLVGGVVSGLHKSRSTSDEVVVHVGRTRIGKHLHSVESIDEGALSVERSGRDRKHPERYSELFIH
jgi:hypothetical protein